MSKDIPPLPPETRTSSASPPRQRTKTDVSMSVSTVESENPPDDPIYDQGTLTPRMARDEAWRIPARFRRARSSSPVGMIRRPKTPPSMTMMGKLSSSSSIASTKTLDLKQASSPTIRPIATGEKLHFTLDESDLSQGDPVALPNLTPSVGGAPLDQQLETFGSTVVAASRLATSSVAAFKTLPENSWSAEDDRRRLGVTNFTMQDLATDSEAKMQKYVVFRPEFNHWEFIGDRAERRSSLMTPNDTLDTLPIQSRPTTPSSILRKSPAPSGKNNHIRIQIPTEPVTPMLNSEDDLMETPTFSPDVVAPSVAMRRRYSLPMELRSELPYKVPTGPGLITADGRHLDTTPVDQINDVKEADKLAALGAVGMRSEQSHMFPYVRERFVHPQTRWFTIGYILACIDFILGLILCIVTMVVVSESHVAPWLSIPLPSEATSNDYAARYSSVISYKTFIVYPGLSIWSLLFQLGFFIDAIINNNPVELLVVYGFVLAAFASAIFNFINNSSSWNWINTDPFNPYPNSITYAQHVTWQINLAQVIIAVIEVILWTPVCWKLYKLVGWKIYEWTGADIRVRNRVRAHQIFTILLRLLLFFVVSFSIMWVVFVLDGPYLSGTEVNSPNLVGFIIGSFLLALVGWLATRFQSLIVLGIYCLGLVLLLIFLPMGLALIPSGQPGPEWANPLPAVGVITGATWIVTFTCLCSSLINGYYFWNGPILSWHALENVDGEAEKEVWWQLPSPVKRFIGRWTGWKWLTQKVDQQYALPEKDGRMSIDVESVKDPDSLPASIAPSAVPSIRQSFESVRDEVPIERPLSRANSRKSRPLSIVSVKISQRRENDRWAIDE